MVAACEDRSFYFFDIDDNLLFLPTKLYLWNAETLAAVPPILGIYTVTNPDVRKQLKATAEDLTVPLIKKMAINDAVQRPLEQYGADPPHRFGMSDDDPNNVVLAISAMRDCKLKYPDKRFFVINTNHEEYVKLEIFPMADPVTASDRGHHLLKGTGQSKRAAEAAAKPRGGRGGKKGKVKGKRNS
jgi:hypothetical protein